MNIFAKFQLYLMASKEMILFRKFSLSVAIATNRIERFEQNNMFGRGLHKEHFCKTFGRYLK